MAKVKYKFTPEQKAALSGKEPMTKELFWQCLDIYRANFEMNKMVDLWHKYPAYRKEFHDRMERELSDPNSEEYKLAEEEWKELKPKLIEILGEEYVEKNCID